jgi:hypothetical protein
MQVQEGRRRVAHTVLRSIAVAFLAAAAAPGAATACDSTCCLMLTKGQGGLLRKGGFSFDFSFRSTDMSVRRSGSSPTAEVIRPKVLIEEGRLIPGYHEDLDGTDRFLQIDAAWGVLASTTVFASLPLTTQRQYQIGHGGTQTGYNLRGIGDLVVGARYGIVRGPQHSVVGSVGFQVPTGSNDIIDVYDSTILDPTLQPGTGSGDFIASLLWSTVAPAKTEFGLSGSYQVYSTNDHDYRFGNLAIVAATLSRPTKSFVPSVQVKLVQQAQNSFVGEAVPSTGGTTVYLNGGLRYRTPEGIGLYVHVLAPVYRYVKDAQLTPRLSVLVGIAKAF